MTFIPSLILGSLIGYVVSQNFDVYIFHKLKNITGEKNLWFRNNASTILSQLIDSVLVWSIAFYGIIPDLINLILVNWIFKVIVAFTDTPFVYLAKYLNKEK